MEARARTVDVRRGTQGELGAIRRLYGEVFGDQARRLLERRFAWQFEETPAARSTPSLHFVAVLDGRVVGSLSSFPARIKLGDRVETTLVPCDLQVAPEGRGRGLGMRLLEAHQETCGVVSLALAYTPWTSRFYDRLDYAPLPAEPVLFRPLNLEPFFASAASRWFGETGPASHLARAAAAAAGRLATVPVRLVNGLRRPAGDATLRVSVAESPDRRFDVIWERVSPFVPACFVRDRAHVAWRYYGDPISRHTVLVAETADGEAAGFLAYRLRSGRGARVCQVMDVFCDPAAPDVARRLVLECLRREEARVDRVQTKGLHPMIRSAVGEFLYASPRARSLPARVWWPAGARSRPGLDNAGAWHLAPGDGDEDFLP